MTDRERAEAILRVGLDPHVIARVAELGRKADDGTLSYEEQREYECLANAGDLTATMKAKARRFLDEKSG